MGKRDASKTMSAEEREARMAAFLARKPRNPRTRKYLEDMKSARDKPRPTFVILHEPRFYGRFVEPIALPVKAASKRGLKRDRGVKDYVQVLANLPPLPPAGPLGPNDWISLGSGVRIRSTRTIRRSGSGTDPHLWVILDIQGGVCALCGEEIDRGIPRSSSAHPDMATIEHVVPRAHGGREYKNKLVTHSRCNHAKGNAMPSSRELAWLAIVNARLWGDD